MRDKKSKEQFESLGRFVQDFELMIDCVRFVCLHLVARSVWQQRLLNIVFHHSALTARPLFDIMRAMMAEIISDPQTPFDKNDRDTIKAVLVQIDKEYKELVEVRNELLHGTWFIGWYSDADPVTDALSVRKGKATKSGLQFNTPVADTAELNALTRRCKSLEHFIRALSLCFDGPDSPCASACFKRSHGVWTTTIQSA